jgi:hypothetical protein
MIIDEIRKQVSATRQWPITIRVDGRPFLVERGEDIMIPPAGNLICIYQDGAFHILDCGKISVLSKEPVSST